MTPVPPELAGNADRLKWNARFGGDFTPPFAPHPLAVQALALDLPPGPVLELACGPSGSALLAARQGRSVTAVDASDVGLQLLGAEAARAGLSGRVTLVQADLTGWAPERRDYALVLCTGYWDARLFGDAAASLAPGGVLGWESLTQAARVARPSLLAGWCVGPGEPASLLPAGFGVLSQQDAGPAPAFRRRLLARRQPPG